MTSEVTTTLYLRGVARHVVREAKAAAARAGKPLGRWVSEQLAQVTGAAVRGPSGDSLHAEMMWFEANRRQLEREYAGEYVAIVDQRVIDHDPEFASLAQRMFERFGVRSICMPKVGRGEVRLRSPRRARS